MQAGDDQQVDGAGLDEGLDAIGFELLAGRSSTAAAMAERVGAEVRGEEGRARGGGPCRAIARGSTPSRR